MQLQPVESKSDFKKLVQKEVANFKINKEEPLSSGTISVEQYKEHPLFIIVFRNKALQIKSVHSLYQKISIAKTIGANKDTLVI